MDGNEEDGGDSENPSLLACSGGHRQMEESSSVGFYPGSFVFMPHLNQAGPFCCKRWAEDNGPDTKSVLNLGDLGAEPRVSAQPCCLGRKVSLAGA